MNIVSGTAGSLLDIYRQVAGYRYKVFVENLGWDLHAPDGLEQDQFDRPDTIYVAVSNNEGEVCGCARLLPTTHPYLLSEVFPQLLNGAAPPNSPEIWELSRFAAVRFAIQGLCGGEGRDHAGCGTSAWQGNEQPGREFTSANTRAREANAKFQISRACAALSCNIWRDHIVSPPRSSPVGGRGLSGDHAPEVCPVE